jgi:putative tricarboxylic transport membrane protein
MVPERGKRAWRPQIRNNSNDTPLEEIQPMMTDRVIFVCTIIIAAVYFYATTLIPSLEIGDPLGPKAFPRLLGVFLLIAAGLLFLEMWKDRKQPAQQVGEAGANAWQHAGVIAGVTVWTGLYYIVFDRLGYIVVTTVYLLALMAWFNRGKWTANILTSLLFSGLSYWMFVTLDVNLPKGILPF